MIRGAVHVCDSCGTEVPADPRYPLSPPEGWLRVTELLTEHAAVCSWQCLTIVAAARAARPA